MTASLRPYSIGCSPSSVSAEILIQDGWSTFLLFFAHSEAVGSSGHFEDKGVAVLECESCSVTKFGYPNDEGLTEHPMFGLGLGESTARVFEVVGSPWAAELEAQRRASAERIWGGRGMHVPHVVRKPTRHFLMPLKERTFECLATELTVRLHAEDFAEAFAYVHRRLAEH